MPRERSRQPLPQPLSDQVVFAGDAAKLAARPFARFDFFKETPHRLGLQHDPIPLRVEPVLPGLARAPEKPQEKFPPAGVQDRDGPISLRSRLFHHGFKNRDPPNRALQCIRPSLRRRHSDANPRK